jgi:hypothetical protein
VPGQEFVDLPKATLADTSRYYVEDPAKAVTRPPSDGSAPAEQPLGEPTAILIDPGQPEPAAAAPKTRAEPVPQTGPALPPGMSGEAPNYGINVRLGKSTVRLPCTEEAVWGLVTKAWIADGFDGVIRARHAIENAVIAFDTATGKLNRDAVATRAKLAHEEGLYDGGRHPEYAGNVDSVRKAVNNVERDARRASAAAVEAHVHHPQYHALFRDVWHRIAVVEEGLLREWERLGHAEFRTVMWENATTAKSEWTRYGCYHKDDAQKAVADIAKVTGDAADYRLNLKTSDEDKDPLQRLLNTAQELKELARQIATRQSTLERGVEGAARQGFDPAEQRRLRKRGIDDWVEAWRKRREEVRKTDPVLASVYPRVQPRRTTKGQLQEMIVEALLEAYRTSNAILAEEEKHRLMGKGALRITPSAGLEDAPPQDEAQQAALHVGDNWEAFTKFRLTIPASAVLVERLKAGDNAKFSPWLHMPSRLRVYEKLKTHPTLRRMNDAGTVEFAAIAHLYDWLERSRQSDKRAREIAMRVLLVEAIVLAPFTMGGSLAVAGVVQAAFCGEEIYEAAKRHEQEGSARAEMRRELLPAEVLAAETALWTRPSLVDFVRTVASKTVEAGLNLIPAERIPFVVGLAIGEAAGASAPAERTVTPQSAVTGVAKRVR